MTPEEFKNGLDKLNWKQSDFAMATGITPVSVSHWVTGTTPLPVWAKHHLELLLKLHDMAATLLEPPTRAAKAARLLEKEKAKLIDD